MIIFPLLCCMSVLAGLGLVFALRLPIPTVHRWLVAPGVLLVAWALTLGITVSWGVPVYQLAFPLWAATAALAAYGGWCAARNLSREAAAPLLVSVLAPVAVMWFDIRQGLDNFIGGPNGDGWSYVAQGQRLWALPKDLLGHFSPLYQYAGHLHSTRFISSSILALLSPLTGSPGDTQTAVGYFLAWSLFVFCAACAAVAYSSFKRRTWLIAFCLAAIMSRWIEGAIQVHNYDNLLALSLLPLTMALVSEVQTLDWRASIGLGAALAAMVYCYPEMAAFTALAAALAAARWIRIGTRTATGVFAAGLIVASVLLIPAWRDLQWYAGNQFAFATGAPGTRAGEGNFPELIGLGNLMPAFWGLTSGVLTAKLGLAWVMATHAVGIVLSLLAVVGAVGLFRRRRWDVVVMAGLLIAGALFMIEARAYPYGAYKFILFGSWISAWCVVAGAEVTLEGFAGRARTVAKLSLAALAVSVGLLQEQRIVAFHDRLQATSIAPFRAVQHIKPLLSGEPIALDASDVLANEWAVYFLRDTRLRILGYRGYMAFPHVAPLMDQADAPDLRDVKYVLGDDPARATGEVVWHEGFYWLWRVPAHGAAFLERVSNPNGTEMVDGRSYYWVGAGDTLVDVFATVHGTALLSGQFVRGPSLPDSPVRHLLIGHVGQPGEPITITTDGPQSLSVPVDAGENHIFIRPVDVPSVRAARDHRPLLLGLQGLSAAMTPEPPTTNRCTFAFTSGWFAEESDGLRWSDGNGRLTIRAQEAMDLVLRGQWLSFIRPNVLSISSGGRQIAQWNIDDPAWAFHGFPPLPLHVDAGKSVVLTLSSRAAAVRQPPDPRPLAIALNHVTVVQKDQPVACAAGTDRTTAAPAGRH